MTNFKIVPVEPTEEMLRVACDEEQRPLPMWTRMKAIYTATLDEAPVINIVATKNEQGQIVSVTLQDEDHRILEVIAEADVQGEPVVQREVSQTAIIDTCDHGHKFAKLDDHPGNSCAHCLRIGLARARAEVERLREQGGTLVEALEHAIDRLEGEGLYYSAATVRCRKALATYRKGVKS